MTGNNLGDEGITNIMSALQGNTTLKRLNLGGTLFILKITIIKLIILEQLE